MFCGAASTVSAATKEELISETDTNSAKDNFFKVFNVTSSFFIYTNVASLIVPFTVLFFSALKVD